MILQLCGLSGAGKTTLATNIQLILNKSSIRTKIIDGDEYRKTICSDLGFSKADRRENIRRLGVIANEYSLMGYVSIISAINPYQEIRTEIKGKYKNVKEIFVDCSLTTLIQRDTKGLYKKALLPAEHPDKLKNLTGINDIFEIPTNPDLHIYTGEESLDQSLEKLFTLIITAIGDPEKIKKDNQSQQSTLQY